jgi:putative membrane protein
VVEDLAAALLVEVFQAEAAQLVRGERINMQTTDQLFSSADRKQIADAVKAAESETSAEIAPVVAMASGRYDRGEDVFGLWVGISAMIAVWFLVPDDFPAVSEWGDSARHLKLGLLIGAVLFGFLFGAMIAGRSAWLRRLFTAREEMAGEVWRSASRVFFDNRIHHTKSGTGIMIYLSLLEHRAVVLADQQVEARVGRVAMEELCQQVTSELHDGKTVTEALCATIISAGEKLGPVLPRETDDENELGDALITIEAI